MTFFISQKRILSYTVKNLKKIIKRNSLILGKTRNPRYSSIIKETLAGLLLIKLETERFELSSGMGYKPASTSVGLLILVNLRHEPILKNYQSSFN